MTTFVRTVVTTLVLLIGVGSAVVYAEPPSAKDKAHARELYALGQQMFRQGDFGGALRAFEDAYRTVPNPIVLLSIAECQVRTEQYTEAVVSLTQYLEERPDAPDREQVQAQIDKLRQIPGVVTVDSTPAGAAIWVDGMPTGLVTPAQVELLAGDHVISIQAEGYSTAQQPVTVLIGGELRVNLTAIPEAQEPAQELPAVPNVDLNPKLKTEGMLPVWVATGVAGAGLVTGAILGGFALKQKGEFDARPSEAKADKGERLALFADVGFGIAAAAGVTALVLYFTRDKAEETTQHAWSVKPHLSKNNLGLTGRLHF
jgi:hypothetical protein